MALPEYEKLGQFYLGKAYDLGARKRLDQLIMYDSKDLVTHAVCVGMTGSGKTGLCLGILEEAAIDSIPAIIIDPKGDLSNLLLTFPKLEAGDFRPWINEDDARKKGVSPDDFAAAQASLWKKGLAEWGQDGERIQRLKDSAEFVIYTPGSSAGVQVSVLKSFDVPPDEIMEDSELFTQRVGGTVTSLLGLMGIDADPIQSREHILLSSVFSASWSKRQSLDLASIIQQIQKPSFDRLGVMPLESVYPAKERFELAMKLNNIVASPTFQSWLSGEPLDIGRMLYANGGKPRMCVFSIAHLSDAERMFFVAMLYNQILAWVRTQSGTTSLRALVYMDEIAGYFPPVANPPSKQPMLTLMKQARAFGVGMVMATQNPVDLDYKGLANAGTWFIGRLQTERDKQRVLDGLEGAAAQASAKFDRASCDKALSQLGSRVFLMNNVHDDHPVIIESRWALCYLRGPLTRDQIKQLMNARKASGPLPEGGAGVGSSGAVRAVSAADAPVDMLGDASSRSAKSAVSATLGTARPVLPPEIPQYFLPARAIPAGSSLVYHPMLLGSASVYYSDPKIGIDQNENQSLMVPITTKPVPVNWDDAEQVDISTDDLEQEPSGGATFAPLAPSASSGKSITEWSRGFADALFKLGKLELLKSSEMKMTSKQGESEKDFRLRLAQSVREERDAQKERLRAKYAPKISALEDRIRRSEQRVDVEKQQSTSSKIGAAISFGAAVLGAFMGRKVVSATNISKAATAMKSAGRVMKESGDVGRAEENTEALRQQCADLEAQFKAEVDALDASGDPMTDPLEKLVLKPKKTNIKPKLVALAWAPMAVDSSGNASPAW